MSGLSVHGVGGFLHLQKLLVNNGGLWNAETLFTSALSLILGLPSVCDPQRHLIVVSAPALPNGSYTLILYCY